MKNSILMPPCCPVNTQITTINHFDPFYLVHLVFISIYFTFYFTTFLYFQFFPYYFIKIKLLYCHSLMYISWYSFSLTFYYEDKAIQSCAA